MADALHFEHKNEHAKFSRIIVKIDHFAPGIRLRSISWHGISGDQHARSESSGANDRSICGAERFTCDVCQWGCVDRLPSINVDLRRIDNRQSSEWSIVSDDSGCRDSAGTNALGGAHLGKSHASQYR